MKIKIYKILGLILVICANLGYIFVADELRHLGEFLGVSAILFSGILLLVKSRPLNIFNKLAIEWISLSLLLSIPIGGIVLDNMPLSIIICTLFGLILANIFRKKINLYNNSIS